MSERSSKLVSILASAALCAIAIHDRAAGTATPFDEGIQKYRSYLAEGISQSLTGARALKDSIAANDLKGAQQAWLSARAGWERSEVFTGGFVPELDTAIDAWPDATTGFHAIEARLFGAGTMDVRNDVSDLVDRLAELDGKIGSIELNSQGVLDGMTKLAYEVGESKSDGGESRISGTSLDDMHNNVLGVEYAYNTIFAPALKAKDEKLASSISGQLAELKKVVDVQKLNDVDVSKLRKVTETLAVSFQNAAPKLGLARPKLEMTP